ncbi:RNB domain-containing ribonuclease [Microbacterium deminutum]|uniref:RNB domain-containing ribonuclease n=1 Tax=Microbacterium deminutum TaxID=344164 RepID=UPI0031E2B159
MPARRSRLVPATATGALVESLASLRQSLDLPSGFPRAVLAEARDAARSVPTDPAVANLADLRDLEFLTIDPPGSPDLDQAMHFQQTSEGAVLHYAIADVPAFVTPGGELDAEVRLRGQTLYAADGRIPLHPPVLSEDAASLVDNADRRAYVWRFTLDSGARPLQTTLTRAIVRSRHRWSYPDAQAALQHGSAPETLRTLAWFGPLRAQRESERGGASLNVPETTIEVDHGTYRLQRNPPLPLEDWNAQVSLLTGMAAAEIMLAGGIGVLRTMPAAGVADVAAFRAQTVALGIPWRDGIQYGDYLRTLDRDDPAALAVRSAAASLFRGAGYVAFDGRPPTQTLQAAIGAPYAHTTAPLRRLVDRWSLVVCEALANGRPVPEWARQSLPEIPKLMGRSDQRADQFDAASIHRVEAALLHGQESAVFPAVVLAEQGGGSRVQLANSPVTARVAGMRAPAGSRVEVRLERADIATGEIEFAAVGASAGTTDR